MSSFHPQLVGKDTGLEPILDNRLLEKVKSSHHHEYKYLREEIPSSQHTKKGYTPKLYLLMIVLNLR